MDKLVLSPQEVCQLLDLSITTVYKLLRSGKIPGMRVCRHWKVPRKRLLEWVEGQENGGGEHENYRRNK